ncbi:hypothetical protein GZH53_13660 [Flavihumibacter sp. R14]|nr:hypothetical protein [Flavihumibacter soli]
MKKIYTLNLAACLLLVLLFGCKKDPGLPDGLKLPTLTINRISELPFSNTEWDHVFGGMAEVKFIKGSSTITDSLDMAKLAGYGKTLELGTYDIQLRSKSTAAADSFIRFSAELKGLVVDKGQSLSFAGSTTDGLITIRKEVVSANSVPTFTPAQAGAKSYKFGLIDGYYFIYVKAGTTGQVAFDSKATDDQITKNLTIAATNHYNLVVVTSGTSSFAVELQKFAYNEVQVSGPALLRLETPEFMKPGFDYTFVIADDAGRILNSFRYEQGTKSMQVASNVPFTKDRLSVFLLSLDLNNVFPPRIDAYMNVKKGSTWTVPAKPAMRPYSSPLQVSFKYVPAYESMTFSTDRRGWAISASHAAGMALFTSAIFSYSEVSKVYLQIENAGRAFYNFFDISKGTASFEIDPALCTIPSASKIITLPPGGTIEVSAKKDKNYNEDYNLGGKEFENGTGVYFYPNEPFEEYSTIFRYESNGISYADIYQGSDIPQTTSPINLSLEANGNSLAAFAPTVTGQFDHYKAEFKRGSLRIAVISPSTAMPGKLSYPDLAVFPGFSEFSTSTMYLQSMEAFQYEGFAENQLPYKDWHNYDLPGKAVQKWY